jgi:hypothetical protein
MLAFVTVGVLIDANILVLKLLFVIVRCRLILMFVSKSAFSAVFA